jgi:hypothetical protein
MTLLAFAQRRSALILALAAAPLLGLAQGINIQTPQMPPRGAAPSSGGAAAQPGYGAGQQPPGYGGGQAQPGYGGQQPPGYGSQQPGYGGQQPGSSQPGQQPGWGQQPGYQQPQGHAGVAASAPQGLASPLQQRRAGGGFQQPGFGQPQYGQPQYAQPGTQGQPQVTMVAPTPSAAGGTCKVQPSPDRTSISLVGPDGQPRRHAPLGEFRVQQVVHSPDGQWAVVLTKLRGEPQFAAMTVDLNRCETTNTFDLPAAGEDVRFEADAAVVQMTRGERRLRLASTRVR